MAEGSSSVARKLAKSPIRSSNGLVATRPSSVPVRWTRALDQGQSRGWVTRRARTGFIGT